MAPSNPDPAEVHVPWVTGRVTICWDHFVLRLFDGSAECASLSTYRIRYAPDLAPGWVSFLSVRREQREVAAVFADTVLVGDLMRARLQQMSPDDAALRAPTTIASFVDRGWTTRAMAIDIHSTEFDISARWSELLAPRWTQRPSRPGHAEPSIWGVLVEARRAGLRLNGLPVRGVAAVGPYVARLGAPVRSTFAMMSVVQVIGEPERLVREAERGSGVR